jgi:hypothetical protein
MAAQATARDGGTDVAWYPWMGTPDDLPVTNPQDVTSGRSSLIALLKGLLLQAQGGGPVGKALPAALVVSSAASAPRAVSVGTAAVQLDTGFASRTTVVIVNNGTSAIYVGLGANASAVLTTTGLPVAANGGSATFAIGPGVPVYAISTAAGQDVRVVEF